MSKKILHNGHVGETGKLSIYNRESFVNSIRDYFKNTSIIIEVSERVYPFTDKLRGYYFGVIVPEMQKAYRWSGDLKTRKKIDEELRSMFLYYEVVNDAGEYEKFNHTLKKGDSSVSQKMMSEFCELCIIHAISCLGWAIPFPSENFGDNDKPDLQIGREMVDNYRKATNG